MKKHLSIIFLRRAEADPLADDEASAGVVTYRRIVVVIVCLPGEGTRDGGSVGGDVVLPLSDDNQEERGEGAEPGQ
jgi:hypothetical protein